MNDTGQSSQAARSPGPSIKYVAHHAGVSVGTVSNVLNTPRRVSERTRERVQTVIKELGYVRSEHARQLRGGRSRLLALLVLDLANPFYVEIARGAETAARAAGLGVMVCSSGRGGTDESHYLDLFAEHRVRGVLVTPAATRTPALGALRRQGIPYVLADCRATGPDTCSVSVDDVTGGEMAGRHLAAAGHRSIAYVRGPAHLRQVADRGTGLLRALAEAGQTDHVTEIPSDTADVSAGRDALARLLGLARRPSAVFCSNDLMALGVLQAAYEAGISVPRDLAIVGYDDIEYAAAAAVPLTSVRQPAYELGSRAVDLLLGEASGSAGGAHTHRNIVLRPELVVRKSTRS
ncbi:LacI family DNA-binding transcriptional regulator [Streptomyces durocortorensis]|uniref:LacI family DNA-binding transcriptional regulator n=1 Tax=Streptomyces durocortorensis TaxID=2811104 RepID=A0ABS2HTC7_9ACTN|nr:LacI family DNA-binding transcriptional regulator [Streptomyces durocortorensis]MBM7054306.1 LacI family DNA-binding transcriptional regulator [Streptomyces durocortorensis]